MIIKKITVKVIVKLKLNYIKPLNYGRSAAITKYIFIIFTYHVHCVYAIKFSNYFYSIKKTQL